MAYKAVFLDIDRTLLVHNGPISEGNMRAIRRAQDAGIYVTIATGRGYLGCTRIWKELQIAGPIIVFGGAAVLDTRTDEPLFLDSIAPDLITEALEYARELQLPTQIYQDTRVISEADNPYSARYVSVMDLPYVIDPDIRTKTWQNMPKILAFSPVEAEAENVARLQERFRGRLEVASSNPGFIELNRFGTNKGTTMLRLAEQLGFAQEELIAVGDNTLDLEMIKLAGLGVCVGNGQQVVKDIADVIAPDCEDDGVKWVIDKFIFGE